MNGWTEDEWNAELEKGDIVDQSFVVVSKIGWIFDRLEIKFVYLVFEKNCTYVLSFYSVSLSFCLFVSVFLFFYFIAQNSCLLFLLVSLNLTLFLSVCLSCFCLSVYVYFDISLFLSIDISVVLSFFLSLCLSVFLFPSFLSVHMSYLYFPLLKGDSIRRTNGIQSKDIFLSLSLCFCLSISHLNCPFLKRDSIRRTDVVQSGHHEEAEGRLEVVEDAVHRRQNVFLERFEKVDEFEIKSLIFIHTKMTELTKI